MELDPFDEDAELTSYLDEIYKAQLKFDMVRDELRQIKAEASRVLGMSITALKHELEMRREKEDCNE